MNMLFDSTVALYTQEIVLSTDPYNLVLCHHGKSLWNKKQLSSQNLRWSSKKFEFVLFKNESNSCVFCPPALFPVGILGIMGTDSLTRTQVLESQMLPIKIGSLVIYISVKVGRVTHRPQGSSWAIGPFINIFMPFRVIAVVCQSCSQNLAEPHNCVSCSMWVWLQSAQIS